MCHLWLIDRWINRVIAMQNNLCQSDQTWLEWFEPWLCGKFSHKKKQNSIEEKKRRSWRMMRKSGKIMWKVHRVNVQSKYRHLVFVAKLQHRCMMYLSLKITEMTSYPNTFRALFSFVGFVLFSSVLNIAPCVMTKKLCTLNATYLNCYFNVTNWLSEVEKWFLISMGKISVDDISFFDEKQLCKYDDKDDGGGRAIRVNLVAVVWYLRSVTIFLTIANHSSDGKIK